MRTSAATKKATRQNGRPLPLKDAERATGIMYRIPSVTTTKTVRPTRFDGDYVLFISDALTPKYNYQTRQTRSGKNHTNRKSGHK